MYRFAGMAIHDELSLAEIVTGVALAAMKRNRAW